MSDDPIKSIFFEKQEGQLCAQHALNMLLQKDLFNAVDLANIANTLDRKENDVLDAGHKVSQNMDDSGFFSVQVIAEALKTFDLELISILHPGVAEIKADPLLARAFILNRSEHWFTIRKFGRQWFGLNSTREGPELLTDTYVSCLLAQFTANGYTIFVVQGELPDCVAEHVILANPIKFVPPKRKEPEDKKEEENKKKEVAAFSGSGQRLGDSSAAAASAAGAAHDEDAELQEAIRRSLEEKAGSSSHAAAAAAPPAHHDDSYEAQLQRALELTRHEDESEDAALQRALAMSMMDAPSGSSGSAPSQVQQQPQQPQLTQAEIMRAQRERAFLGKF